MRILTLDQATRTGWAFGIERSDERWKFGSFRMPKRDDNGERLVIFRDGLVGLIEEHQPDLIAYEQPYMPLGTPQKVAKGGEAQRAPFSPKTISFLLHIEGVLIETTARHLVPTEHYPSSSWRTTALGMGRLPPGAQQGEFKRMMIRRAKALGYEVADDNEADAIGILMHLLMGAPAAKRAQGDLLAMESGKL